MSENNYLADMRLLSSCAYWVADQCFDLARVRTSNSALNDAGILNLNFADKCIERLCYESYPKNDSATWDCGELARDSLRGRFSQQAMSTPWSESFSGRVSWVDANIVLPILAIFLLLRTLYWVHSKVGRKTFWALAFTTILGLVIGIAPEACLVLLGICKVAWRSFSDACYYSCLFVVAYPNAGALAIAAISLVVGVLGTLWIGLKIRNRKADEKITIINKSDGSKTTKREIIEHTWYGKLLAFFSDRLAVAVVLHLNQVDPRDVRRAFRGVARGDETEDQAIERLGLRDSVRRPRAARGVAIPPPAGDGVGAPGRAPPAPEVGELESAVKGNVLYRVKRTQHDMYVSIRNRATGEEISTGTVLKNGMILTVYHGVCQIEMMQFAPGKQETALSNLEVLDGTRSYGCTLVWAPDADWMYDLCVLAVIEQDDSWKKTSSEGATLRVLDKYNARASVTGFHQNSKWISPGVVRVNQNDDCQVICTMYTETGFCGAGYALQENADVVAIHNMGGWGVSNFGVAVIKPLLEAIYANKWAQLDEALQKRVQNPEFKPAPKGIVEAKGKEPVKEPELPKVILVKSEEPVQPPPAVVARPQVVLEASQTETAPSEPEPTTFNPSPVTPRQVDDIVDARLKKMAKDANMPVEQLTKKIGVLESLLSKVLESEVARPSTSPQTDQPWMADDFVCKNCHKKGQKHSRSQCKRQNGRLETPHAADKKATTAHQASVEKTADQENRRTSEKNAQNPQRRQQHQANTQTAQQKAEKQDAHNKMLNDLSLDVDIRKKYGFESLAGDWAKLSEMADTGDKPLVQLLRQDGLVPYKLFIQPQAEKWGFTKWKAHVMRVEFKPKLEAGEAQGDLWNTSETFYICEEYKSYLASHGFVWTDGKISAPTPTMEEILNGSGPSSEPVAGTSGGRGSRSRRGRRS